ncbi:MAG: PIG-L family deacetylase [Deltaproteobacteria bacterium]|nr:PIG-L family deacetylase [Deltaproteobacteria bacterium]
MERTALLLVAHADDTEFFAGATVARLVSEGYAVTEVIATGLRPELLPLLDRDNYRPALDALIRAWAGRVGAKAGYEYGEEFRYEVAGGFLDGLVGAT